jgi:tripartite-type tricarboxylate transporter receptor subunit TctC
MRKWLSAGLAALALAATGPTAAQDFPTKPVRIVIGYAAGGGNDIIVRVMQPKLTEGLGQPVIVENRPGAQGIIAAELVARQPADGYTLLMGPSGPMTINPATYSKLPYSPTKDFAPISMICQFPLILAVGAKLPVSSVKELVDYARQRPTQVNYASSAAPFQMAAELFKQRTGTQFVHIPYKSSGESIKSVVAGESTMTVIAEAGLPELEIGLWTAFFAPAGTPAPVVKRLQEEVARVVRLPEIRERFATMSLDPVGSSSEELGRRVAADIERWTAVAKAANIRND